MNDLKWDTTLVIGGVVYDLVSSCQLVHDGNPVYGFCDPGHAHIYVEDEMDLQPQVVAILHEVIHAMLNALGYQEHDEVMLSGLANQLYQFISKNPEFIRKVQNVGSFE